MIVIGLLIFAVAVAAAIVFIVQNQSAMVDVHGLGYTWNMHLYWVLIAGLVIAAVGLLGAAMMRTGAAHAARVRVERRGLVRENARLNDLAADRPAGPPVVPVTPAAVPVAPAEPLEPTRMPVATERSSDDDTPVQDTASAPRYRQLLHRTGQA